MNEKINQFYGENHEVLTCPAETVPLEDMDKAEEIGKSLISIGSKYPECVGLTANQVYEVIPPPAVFVVKIGNDWSIFINPLVKGTGKKFMREEGCMSRLGKKPKRVKRDKNVTISFYKKTDGWNLVTEKYTGVIAQIIQHEMDHINGKII
jgi:peptide deformylase